MKISNYKRLVDYSRGTEKPSLVLKNANLVMVQSGELVCADLAIQDGYIVGIGDYDGENNIDCRDKYVSPGFIDSHLHFESTMANPDELVHYASLSGTTCFIADRKSTRLNSSHANISYAVFCLKKTKCFESCQP